jgi:hypothetical protein
MKVRNDIGSTPSEPGTHPAETGSTDSFADPGRSLPGFVAFAFSRIDAGARARLLSRLLRAVGPLALAVVGGGAFFKFIWQARAVTVEDAARVTSGQVFELAAYVQQSSPDLAEQVLALLSQDVSTMSALGASATATAIAIGMLSRQALGRKRTDS